MWKWIVGIGLVGGLLTCVAGVGAGGWVWLSRVRETESAARAEALEGLLAALDRLLALDDQNARGFRDRADARYPTGDVAGALTDAKQACTLGLTEGCTLEQRIQAATRR